MALLDRVSAELDKVAKRAGQVLDEGRLRMDLLRARRRMDNAARELGYLTYRQAKGEQAPEGEVASLTRRIAAAEAEAATLEAQIAEVRGGAAQAESAAAPGTPGPSEPDAQVSDAEPEGAAEPPGAEATATQTPEEPRGEAPPV